VSAASKPPAAKTDDDEESAESEDTAYRGRKPSGSASKKEELTVWQRATYRWAAITAVMAALLILYTQHPYYQGGQFQPWRPFYTTAFVVWLFVGLPYVKATIEKFSSTRYVVRDGALHLLLAAKSIQHAFGGPIWKGGLTVGAVGGAVWLVGSKMPNETFDVGGKAVMVAGLIAAGASIPMNLARQPKETKRFFRLFKRPRVRTTFLGIFVKGFFTPLMIGFVTGHINTIADLWLRHKHLAPFKVLLPKTTNPFLIIGAWFSQLAARIGDFMPSGADFSGLFAPGTWTHGDISWGLDVAYNVVFMVDCGWALFGYSLESRWLGNKTRSVEPTAFGWLVCLACYPPFNNVLGTYLPLGSDGQHITSETWLLTLRAITVFLFMIYASATVAFGFKFSNLTNRGIVSRGPYRFVRHPAYLCKCTAWWLEHLPTISLTKAFFLTLLCGVYALRAWTEERHLSKDPDYRAYQKKTPWVLFPGVY
jgi:protein-S-isoprenylcysteine O-methyltransferase Ste14